LTDEGTLVAETCRSLNSLARNVPKRLGNLGEEVRGRISIQVISSLVCERFDAALSQFHDRHPKVEILIDITTGDSVAAALLRDEMDIGVASAQTLRSDLNYDFLFEEVHGAYCGQTHPLYGKTFDHPSKLAAQAFVLTGADEPDVLTAYRTRHGLGLEVAGLSEHRSASSAGRIEAPNFIYAGIRFRRPLGSLALIASMLVN
jgi:DNA-binding transcriptional LysR family regulator